MKNFTLLLALITSVSVIAQKPSVNLLSDGKVSVFTLGEDSTLYISRNSFEGENISFDPTNPMVMYGCLEFVEEFGVSEINTITRDGVEYAELIFVPLTESNGFVLLNSHEIGGATKYTNKMMNKWNRQNRRDIRSVPSNEVKTFELLGSLGLFGIFIK